MNGKDERPAASIGRFAAEPVVFVTDIEASLAFYIEKLGFGPVFTYGEPAYFAQVGRDAARINLRHVDAPVIDASLRDKEQLLSAAITIDDARQLFLAYQAAAVPFFQTLRTEPWGARTFIVSDPDGNLILFAGKGE